jgi:signal transduction histidine kinase/CheY-like chemotaxis protein
MAVLLQSMILLVSLLLSGVCFAQSPLPVAKLSNHEIISLQPFLYYWLPDRPIDFATASAPEQAHNYQPVIDQRAPSGRDIWYRFQLQPSEEFSGRGILDFGEIVFEEVEVFVQTPQGLQRFIAGLAHPYTERTISHQFIATPLSIPGNTVGTVYVRVRTLTGMQTSVALNAMSDERFHEESGRHAEISAGISSSMMTILVFMSIVSTLVFQGRVLIIFLGFAICVLLLQLSHNGHISEWLDLSVFSYRFLFLVLPAVINILSLYFCRYLFDMPSSMPGMNKIISSFCAIYILLIFLIAIVPPEGPIYEMILAKSILSGMASLLVLVFGLRAVQLRIKGSGYYLLGVILFVAIVNSTRLPSYGVGTFTTDSRILVSFGALALMFCFAMATLQKIRMIAEREKQLEKQSILLENQNRVRTDFLISMSHEIRTPINGVLGMAQMLEKTRLDSSQRYYLDILFSAGRTLLNVVNEILDISKLEAGKLEIESIYFDLDQALNYTAEMFGQINRKPGVHFHYENDANLPVHVVGDPVRLQQILNNLLSNAFKFTDTGQVSLRIKLVDNISQDRVLVRIEVEDSGLGINEEALNRLFTPFEQADSTTTRRFGGSGLGLAICKKIVELMGGKIYAASVVGHGSRFWADIPFNIAQREEQRYQNIISNLKGKRITMVMQFPEFNDAYISVLNRWGLITNVIKPNISSAEINWDEADIFYISDMLPAAVLSQWLKAAASHGCPVLLVDGYGENYRPSEYPESEKLRRLRHPISKARLVNLLYQISNNIFSAESEKLSSSWPRNLLDLFLLVAEDNDVNTKVLQAVFAKNQINADFVVNGLEAVERYKNEPARFHAILMDCEMPVMNGFDATREIRRFEKENHIKPVTIIALTAHALLETREACLECGMDDILTKPVNFPALLSRLESLERASNKIN